MALTLVVRVVVVAAGRVLLRAVVLELGGAVVGVRVVVTELLRAGRAALAHHLVRGGRGAVRAALHELDRLEEFFGVCAVHFLLPSDSASFLKRVDADLARLDALLADLGVWADPGRCFDQDAGWRRLQVDDLGCLDLEQGLLVHGHRAITSYYNCATL